MPRPIRPLPSMSMVRIPRFASCAARIVPEAPPPTIATGMRSDLVVRPRLRICGAGLSLVHMIVHAGNRLPGCLGEQARHYRMNDAGDARTDQLDANRNSANAMSHPAHSKRARMLREQAVGQSRMMLGLLLRRHSLAPRFLATPTGFEPVALRLGIFRGPKSAENRQKF